ncbi:hypothetical protein HJC23_007249 [Cyclotella cryptica]|uniref:Uncharacterized protein n=1 Tax=Cyclotella cryptica TaxID=29204 RepID=A0ABD3PZB7_9STRA
MKTRITPTGHPSARLTPSNHPSVRLTPTNHPSAPPRPTSLPSVPPRPTNHPSAPPRPTSLPSVPPRPTSLPSVPPRPTNRPSVPPRPTNHPSVPPRPTNHPSVPPRPTNRPSVPPRPTNHPSVPLSPTNHPSVPPKATDHPSVPPRPTNHPSVPPRPTSLPSARSRPTSQPSVRTTAEPSSKPTTSTTATPSMVPTMKPSDRETVKPTLEPTDEPSSLTSRPTMSQLKDQNVTSIKEPVVHMGQTDHDTISKLVFQGPAFIFGLELNTTSRGEIGRRVLSVALASQLYTHLFQELPFKYRLENVDIDEIQSMSLELVRKLMTLNEDEEATRSHQFVVTANTKFSTDSIPSKSQIADIIMSTRLDVSIFQSSTDGVLKSTRSARIFPLRTSVSAITAQEEKVDESPSRNYSVMIYVLSTLAVVFLIAGSAYYGRNVKKYEKNLADVKSLSMKSRNRQLAEDPNRMNNLPSLETNNTSSFVVLNASENQDGRKNTRSKKRSTIGDGVLFVESESGSYSDYSFADERGLNNEGFACISPTEFAREIAHEVVDEMIDDGFSCGMSTQNSIWHQSSWNYDRDVDIDSVVGDSETDSEGGKKRKKATMRRPSKQGKENRKATGRRTMWPGSRKEKDNKKHQENDEVLFVSTGFEMVDGQKHASRKQDNIFSVASDDSVRNGRSRCMSPGELADQVIDDIVEEGFDCGLSLSGI